MGYPTKVQLITRPGNQQWYVSIPSALANSINLQKGETVEWELDSREILVLVRKEVAAPRKLKRKETQNSSVDGNQPSPVGSSKKERAKRD